MRLCQSCYDSDFDRIAGVKRIEPLWATLGLVQVDNEYRINPDCRLMNLVDNF
jgi:hypothetical protein